MYFPAGPVYFYILLQVTAGLATYYLLRNMGLSRVAALTGGILYELNGTFAWFGHANVNPVPLLPLLLLGVERACRAAGEGGVRGWRLIALALALSIYAGFPETAYLDGLLVLAWILVRVFQRRGLVRKRFIGKVMLGSVAGLMLAAPIIVAFYDYVSHAFIGDHAVTYANAHLPVIALPQVFLPYLYGTIWQYSPYAIPWGYVGGYLGSGMALFAVFAIFGKKERPLRWLLLIWIIIALAKSYGMPVIANLLNVLPLVRYTEFHRYIAPSWEFAAVVLAAFALHDIQTDPLPKKLVIFAAVFTLAVPVVVPLRLAGQFIHTMVYDHHFSSGLRMSLILMAWTIIESTVIYVCMRRQRMRAMLLGCILLFEASILFMVPALAYPRQADLELGGVSFLQQNLGLQRFYTLGPIQPNYGSYFGIASINHNDLPLPSSWVDYVRTNLDPFGDSVVFNGNYPRSNPTNPSQAQELAAKMADYEWVGVKYVVVPAGESLAALPVVYKDDVMSIYQLPDPKPYFEPLVAGSTIKALSRTDAEINSPVPTTLVRRELFFPGWHAQLNGRDVPIGQYQGLFQEISVPAGLWYVRFYYRPPYYEWALLFLVLAAGALLTQTVVQVISYLRPRP